MTRQRKWQLKKIIQGLCRQCGVGNRYGDSPRCLGCIERAAELKRKAKVKL